MTYEEATKIREMYDTATKSGVYLEWNLEQLMGVQKALREARVAVTYHGYDLKEIERILAKLNERISMKGFEGQAERHHTEAMKQGKDTHVVSEKTLFWARWAVLAAVAVPILVALIAEIPLSKLLLSTSSQPQSASSQQAELSATPSATPTPTESPSESPPASPTPLEEATPTETPIKWPPPAP